jgi:hypothetical protein
VLARSGRIGRKILLKQSMIHLEVDDRQGMKRYVTGVVGEKISLMDNKLGLVGTHFVLRTFTAIQNAHFAYCIVRRYVVIWHND